MKQSFTNKLREHPWIFATSAFLIGTLLGTGSLWEYSKIQLANQEYELKELQYENTLSQNLLSLQDKILNLFPIYMEQRDADAGTDQKRSIKNQYVQSRERLIQLICEYNTIEGKLSILEERQPTFFEMGILIYPKAPKDLRFGKRNPDGTTTFSWTWSKDEVIVAVNKRLQTLIDSHNEKVKDM